MKSVRVLPTKRRLIDPQRTRVLMRDRLPKLLNLNPEPSRAEGSLSSPESATLDIFDKIDQRLDKLEDKVDHLSVDMATVKTKLGSLDKRLENQEFVSRAGPYPYISLSVQALKSCEWSAAIATYRPCLKTKSSDVLYRLVSSPRILFVFSDTHL